MSLSGVINSLFDDRLPVWAQKFIDLLFIITTLAATALTLGLGIPMISSNLASLTGIPDNLMLGIGVILGLSVIFSLSSYIGIEKGMPSAYLVQPFISVQRLLVSSSSSDHPL
ncbi:BCCT family transporter [Vibrio harveyi]|uniref:BCCT family transporter n=1 Tax=Vibrio harveyi TaxID=669 RepID=UPI0025B1AA8D|nr:BCCT family transporter [Vibrio harveyi]WJT08820.1 BCCT family transporter [Vibrio harveyi]